MIALNIKAERPMDSHVEQICKFVLFIEPKLCEMGSRSSKFVYGSLI